MPKETLRMIRYCEAWQRRHPLVPLIHAWHATLIRFGHYQRAH